MRSVIVIVWLWLICAVHASPPVTLAWDPSPETDIAGYKLYYGFASENYTGVIDVGNVATYTLTDLAADITYFAAVSAYDTNGLESELSTEVSFTLPKAPFTAPVWLDMQNSRMEPYGLFYLIIRGTNAQSTIIVQASTDLIGWRSIGRVTLDENFSAQFLDYQTPGYSQRFYRVFLLDP